MNIIRFFCLMILTGHLYANDLETQVDSVVSVFENGSPVVEYSAIQNIHDGRGYTAGKAGFTTANGDLLQVVELYLKTNPRSDFAALKKTLRELAKKESGKTQKLTKLPKIWIKSCEDKEFLKSQDEIVDLLYKTPARSALKKYRFESPLAYLIFYDSLIQHGDGSDPDSFSGIIQKMDYEGTDEVKFLQSFLRSRLSILKNPAATDTRRVWRESVDRVHALERLMQENVWDLKSPFSLKVWNEQFNF
jgi:chitosanase